MASSWLVGRNRRKNVVVVHCLCSGDILGLAVGANFDNAVVTFLYAAGVIFLDNAAVTFLYGVVWTFLDNSVSTKETLGVQH